jgi:hypothetical protein
MTLEKAVVELGPSDFTLGLSFVAINMTGQDLKGFGI